MTGNGKGDEAAKPFREIDKRAAKVLRKHGLLTHASTFHFEDGITMSTVVSNDPDYAPKVVDPFEEIIKGEEELERKARREAEAEKSRRELEGLREQLKDPGQGIL
jgi:hypothetical protein